MSTGTLNHDFNLCVSQLMEHGMVAHPRGQETRELLNYNITLMDPRNRIISLPARKTNLPYLIGELVWYLSGHNTVDGILPFSKFWAQITNSGEVLGYPKGTINSNYGNRLFGHANIPGMVHNGVQLNQWARLVKILKADPDSRQAIVNIHMPSDRHDGNKDVACTLTLQFFIRENALHMVTNMRSNDIILGFTNDVFQFTMLQEILLLQLREHFPELELGHYFHNAGSMHIYSRHFEMAEQLANEHMADLSMIPMDRFDTDIRNALMEIQDEYVRLREADNLPDTFADFGAFKNLSPYWQAIVDGLYLRNEDALHTLYGVGH